MIRTGILIFFIVVASSVPVLSAAIDPFFKNIWKEFSQLSNDAGEYLVNEHKNSRTALEFLTLRKPRYERILQEAQDMLAFSAESEKFADIEKLRKKNKELDEEVINLRRESLAAPESSYNPFANTQKSINKRLADIPAEIKRNENNIVMLKEEILANSRNKGLNLSPAELDYFLVSAEGDELIKLMNMAENMKKIQKAIGEELKSDSKNVKMAQMYAGMYLLSLEAFAGAHEKAMENIERYRNKLKEITKGAMANQNEAKRLLSSVDEADQQTASTNIAINERTMEIADLYDQLLDRRNGNLAKSAAGLKGKVNLARNTYKTIMNGGNLIELVNRGMNEYLLIMNFKMPELLNLHDSAMMGAFSDIAERIKMEN